MLRQRTYLLFAVVVIFGMIFQNCSTEKNTFINRSFHQINAKYNGYFNARELIQLNLKSFREKHEDDFTKRLPVKVFPDKEAAQQLYPDMDTAISKSEKVIAKHSMPNPRTHRGAKKEEHNKWIDDTWLVIGQAHYIKKEYGEAKKKLDYVRSSYEGQEAVYAANMWLARIYIDEGEAAQATKYLKDVEAAIDKLESIEKDKEKKGRRDKEVRENDPEDFPKKWMADYLLLQSRLALLKDDLGKAIKKMETALNEHVRGRSRKGRIAFILAQLYEEQSNGAKAAEYYEIAKRKAAKYEMEFHAKINKAIALGKEGEGLKKELLKMIDDEKNLEYRDQIYYALADIELQRSNKKEAIGYLHKSTFNSINNNRQKGRSYLRLATLHFDDKKFIKASGYYDSAVTALPKDYEGIEKIKFKANSLSKLVTHFNNVEHQDSLQAIAELSPDAREKRLKEIKKQIEKEREAQKKRDAQRKEKLAKLKSRSANQGGDGTDWYFYNRNLVTEGVNDFKRLWGDRKIEDYWRLSNKRAGSSFSGSENDTASSEDSEKDLASTPLDSLTTDMLSENLPLSDSARDTSQNILMSSLYRLGVIYREDLEDKEQADHYFTRVIDENLEHKNVLPAAYQLYRLHKESNPSRSKKFKDYILNNYPNSEFANTIRNPEYYKKREERKAKERIAYEALYEKYEDSYYGLVIAKVNRIAREDTANPFLPKYLLLKAFAISKTGNSTISGVRSPLDEVVECFPNSAEAAYAQKIIDNFNKKGKKKNTKVNLDKDLYKYEPEQQHLVVFTPGENVNSSAVKSRVSNFKNQFFRNKNLKLINVALGKDNMVIVKIFKNSGKARDFVQTFESSPFVKDPVLKKCSHFMISKGNFSTLNKEREIEPYLTFYQKKYQSM